MFLSSTKLFEASKINSVDPDQTAPVGAVWSGFTMFASLLIRRMAENGFAPPP